MKRSWINFALDAVIAAAFLLCAATGILFLAPPGWLRVLAFGRPGLLGVSYLTWHALHDWSGVVVAVGVVAHVGLHYRWITKMAARLGKRPRRIGHSAVGRRCPQDARASERRGQPRYSRKGFLVGAAATLGVAALGGVGLLGRGATRSAAAPTETSRTAQALVSVDAGACIACGRCLRVCPAGVFSWSEAGVSQASSPQRCIHCRRCIEACPASAITLAS